MNSRIIAALVAVALIVGMACFLTGFLAGAAALKTGGFIGTVVKAVFPAKVMTLIIAYVVAAIIDVSTGIIKACILGKFSSGEMRKGLWKKAATGGIIGVTLLINAVLYTMSITASIYLSMFVIGSLIAMEIGSVVENAAEAGVPIPNMLRSALKVLKDRGDSELKEGK